MIELRQGVQDKIRRSNVITKPKAGAAAQTEAAEAPSSNDATQPAEA